MPQGVFSITQEPQFTLRQTPMIPGTNVMQGSVIPNTPIVPGGINTQNLVPFPFNYESGMIAETTSDDDDETTIFDQVRNYFTDPNKNTQRGLLSLALTGNPILAALSFFAPRIAETGGGIMDTIKNRFSPAPSVPSVNVNDYSDSGSTTGTGQDVSSSDLSSIGDTGFSEYSDPGTAASYEGSF